MTNGFPLTGHKKSLVRGICGSLIWSNRAAKFDSRSRRNPLADGGASAFLAQLPFEPDLTSPVNATSLPWINPAAATSHRRALHNRVHTAGALLINRPNCGWRCHQRAAGHSWRSARIGSTLVARSAGIRLASTATTMRNSAAPTMLTGSAGRTWYSRGAISGAAARAMAIPTAIPDIASNKPRLMTIRSTPRGSAPSAMRMPISRVRWLTE